MLTPHPQFLRELVDDYLVAAAAVGPAAEAGRGARARDLAYTLCVSTGTRDVPAALARARAILANTPSRAAR